MRRVQKLFERLINNWILKRNRVSYEQSLSINGRVFIQNGGVIKIGNNVVINSSVYANPTAGTMTKLCTTPNGKIEIGNCVGISNTTIFSFKEIVIENDVDLGAGTAIYDSDFHALSYEDRKKEINTNAKPVKICSGAFIGANCTILKGVTIGKHSVVGAGSVVAKNIPDGEIWAGNPAKFIRKL